MSASQGREGRTRTRLGWLGAALAASGLHLAIGADPALACHINHHASAEKVSWIGLHANADDGARDYQNLMHLWQQVKDQNATAPPATASPVTTTSAKAPAAEILPTATSAASTAPVVVAAGDTITPPVATPSVANWHQGQASSCPPPPPCTCSIPMGEAGGNPPPSSSTATAPLSPPAAQNITTPEPSTLLTAVLLAGGLAWRRRAGR